MGDVKRSPDVRKGSFTIAKRNGDRVDHRVKQGRHLTRRESTSLTNAMD